MLSAGVADVVLKFLQSEMPPVQFKLLGTLRMLIDTQGNAVLSGQLGELLNSLDFESLRRTNMKAAPHVCSINDSSRACPTVCWLS